MSNLIKTGKQTLTYTVAVATILWAAGLGALVPGASALTLNAGDLIKGQSSSAVYYYGSDGQRHAFPNEKTYKTWFVDFSKVKTITDAELTSFELASTNITYRPGTKLIKITTDPKVYAIEPGGKLRHVGSEQIAKDLYGDKWNTMVEDVPDVFYGNYAKGAAITTAVPAVGSLIKTADSVDIYYVDASGKRKFKDFTAFSANGFNTAYIRTVSATVLSSVATSTTAGEVAAAESSLATFVAPSATTTTPTTTTPTTTTPTTTPATGTGLTVAIDAAAVPTATLLADATNGGQAQANMAKYKFTAGADGDVVVNTVKLKRIGVASDSDFNNMYLYADGMRLAEMQSIANGVITFTSSAGLFTVAKGTTKEVWVKADLAKTAGSGSTLGVSINAKEDVMASSTAVVVAGTFPLSGALMSVAVRTDLGLLTVAGVSPATATTSDAINNAELWRFSLKADNQKLKVSRLAFTNIGSTSTTDLGDFTLMDGSTMIGTKVVSMDSNKMVTFDLATPLEITSGVTKQLQLRGNIKAGATRTFQFSFQKPSDIWVMDGQYNVSLFPFPTGGTVGLWTVVQAAATTINAGTLTVSKGTDSPTTEVVGAGTNVTLATWDLKANGEDVKISTATFTPTITGNRTIKNVKLFYEGVQVGTTTTTVTGATDFSYSPGNSMIVKADGANHKMSIVADTTGTAVAATNDTILITFKAATNAGQGMASLTSVAWAASAANTTTLKAGSLTPSRVGVTTATYVNNTSKVSLGQWSVQAGSAESIDITALTFKDSNGAGTLNGTAGIGAGYNNLELWNTSVSPAVKIGQTISNPSATAGTQNTFNISPALLVTSSAPVTVELKGAVLSTDTWTDGDAVGISLVTGTGKNTSSTVCFPSAANCPASTTTSTIGPTLTITGTGTLAAAIDTSSAAAAQIYTSGLTDQEFAKLRLTSTNEDIKLSKLVLKTVNGTSNVTNLKLMGTGLTSDPVATVDASGNATFSFATDSQLLVAKDTSKVVTVKGTIGGNGALVPGNFGVAQFGEIDATGASSGTAVQENFGGTQGTNFYVAGTNAYSGDIGDIIYFTATADAGTSTAAGYYMVTTDDDAVNLATGDLDLNGEATDTSWTAGDTVTKLTKVESVAGNGNAGVAYAVGDLVYVYDADDNESRFAVVTTAVASGAAIAGLGFSPAGSVAIAAATDRVTKLSNTNALAGNTMQYEEVEAMATVNASSPAGTGTSAPNSVQTIAKFDIKASGNRDMTLSALTLEKQGSNTPEQYVTKLSLYNGSTKVAEVASTTVAGSTAGAITNADTILNLCSGTSDTAGEIGDITQAEANSLQVGDRMVIVDGTNTNTVTISSIAGSTIAACGSGAPAAGYAITYDGTVNIAASATVTFRNFRVHFDANQSNTGDTAFTPIIISQGGTLTLEVRADTSAVRTGTANAVSFGVTIPGTTGPLTTTTNGMNWTYTKFSTSGTAHTGTTADGYPINAATFSY